MMHSVLHNAFYYILVLHLHLPCSIRDSLRTQKIAKAERKNESSWNLCERIGKSSSAMHSKLLEQFPIPI
jgi:hypothetical protein